MSNLHNKSMTELRAIAQGMRVPFSFADDKAHLIQKIELEQYKIMPKPDLTPPMPAYDARLMTEMPGKLASVDEIKELLKPLCELGLVLTFPCPEAWKVRYGRKEDSGTMRMPLRDILTAARRVFR